MKRPDYRTLQALDAVIRERGFERAAQKLCITQSAVSQRIKQLENMFGQPLLVRTVPPRPTEQGQSCWPCCVRSNCWKRWLGDEQTGSTPLLLSLAVNADSLATWLLPALSSVLSDSPIRLNLQVEDETRTRNVCAAAKWSARSVFSRRRCPVAWSISSVPSTTCSSPRRSLPSAISQRGDPLGAAESAGGGIDHLDDMHQAFLQQNFDLPPGSVPCHIIELLGSLCAAGPPGNNLLYDPASAN